MSCSNTFIQNHNRHGSHILQQTFRTSSIIYPIMVRNKRVCHMSSDLKSKQFPTYPTTSSSATISGRTTRSIRTVRRSAGSASRGVRSRHRQHPPRASQTVTVWFCCHCSRGGAQTNLNTHCTACGRRRCIYCKSETREVTELS